MNKPATTKKAAKPLSIALPEPLEKKIRETASRHHLSISAILKLAIRAGLPKIGDQLEGTLS
jgi:hypothetical protein